MTGKFKVIPINISGSFFFFFWQILKTVVNSHENSRKCNVLTSKNNLGEKKKKKTKLEDSHFPISNLLQSNNNQYHVILAQGQT